MIHVATFTETGGHATNEDCFSVHRHPADSECHIAVIADGQGGRAGGAAAAKLACNVCMTEVVRRSPDSLLIAGTWTTILHVADRAVSEAPQAGFTTLLAFCVAGQFVCGGSCGDSALFLLNSGQAGVALTSQQHKNPPVGSAVAKFVPFAARLTRPWSLVGISDGVWKYVGLVSILKISPTCRGEEIVADSLKRARLPNGGLQDDFTIVVLHDDGD